MPPPSERDFASAAMSLSDLAQHLPSDWPALLRLYAELDKRGKQDLLHAAIGLRRLVRCPP